MKKLIVIGLLVGSSLFANGASALRLTNSKDNQPLDFYTRNKLVKNNKQQFKNKLKNKGIPLFIKRVSGGVEPEFLFQNLSNKTIKYITIMVVGYNSVGDIVSGNLGKKHWIRLLGAVEPNEESLYSLEDDPLFDNKNTSCLEIQKVEVTFMDGNTYTMIDDLKTARFEKNDYNIQGDCSYKSSSSNASSSNQRKTITSSNGITFQVKYKKHGAVLNSTNNSENLTLYLGRDCDAYSKQFGEGSWSWANGGTTVDFSFKQFGFARQVLNIQKCRM